MFDYYDPYFDKLKIGRKNKMSLINMILNQKILKNMMQA